MHSLLRPSAAIALAFFFLTACDSRDSGETSRQGEANGHVVPVVTAEVAPRRISDQIEAVGTTRAADSVEITARVSNVVIRIGFDEGATVEKGQVLVELESSEARANLAAAEAALAEIRSDYQRSQELIRSNAISRSVLDQQAAQLQAAEARLAAARAIVQDHTIRAPFAGRVGLRRVSIGSMVSPGAVITTLDRVAEMQLDFSVPESFLATLVPGQRIHAKSVAWPDETFVGVVGSVDTRVDPVTRTVTVRCRIDNSDGRLRPGMFMTAVLEKNPRFAVAVPELAVVSEGSSKFVFVVQDDVAIQREVVLGVRVPGSVEVTGGLEPGEEVVVEGTQSLRHGMSIRRVESGVQRASS